MRVGKGKLTVQCYWRRSITTPCSVIAVHLPNLPQGGRLRAASRARHSCLLLLYSVELNGGQGRYHLPSSSRFSVWARQRLLLWGRHLMKCARRKMFARQVRCRGLCIKSFPRLFLFSSSSSSRILYLKPSVTPRLPSRQCRLLTRSGRVPVSSPLREAY
jgi:hypothetical protein